MNKYQVFIDLTNADGYIEVHELIVEADNAQEANKKAEEIFFKKYKYNDTDYIWEVIEDDKIN